VGGKLSLAYVRDVTSRLEVHDLDGKLVREIARHTLRIQKTLEDANIKLRP
jgi:hypothetical protein